MKGRKLEYCSDACCKRSDEFRNSLRVDALDKIEVEGKKVAAQEEGAGKAEKKQSLFKKKLGKDKLELDSGVEVSVVSHSKKLETIQEEEEEYLYDSEDGEEEKISGENWVPVIEFKEMMLAGKQIKATLSPFNSVLQFCLTIKFCENFNEIPEQLFYSIVQEQRRSLILKEWEKFGMEVLRVSGVEGEKHGVLFKRIWNRISNLYIRDSFDISEGNCMRLILLGLLVSGLPVNEAYSIDQKALNSWGWNDWQVDSVLRAIN
jgi:hypothetical protein